MPVSFSKGSIILMRDWPDPQGGNRKDRRFVVVAIDEPHGKLWAVGISSKFETGNPKHIRLEPSPRTGLVGVCGALCDTWVEQLPLKLVGAKVGFCHPPRAFNAILDAVATHPNMVRWIAERKGSAGQTPSSPDSSTPPLS